jgi:RNA polymerase sigma factor (TIGR02999 family)
MSVRLEGEREGSTNVPTPDPAQISPGESAPHRSEGDREGSSSDPTPEPAENCPEESAAFVALYDDLRRVARGLIRRKAWDEHALDPTSLVNQAIIRLLQDAEFATRTDPRYVFAAALRAMRRILVERARTRNRRKRGGDWQRIPLDDLLDHYENQKIDVPELNDAIERLARHDERQAEIVSMRYFLGMTVAEIAAFFERSESTVHSDLQLARAWLRRALTGAEPAE